MSFIEDLDDKITEFLVNNKEPSVIYITQEEHDKLIHDELIHDKLNSEYKDRRWDGSPISKTANDFHGVPVRILERGGEIRMASLLDKEQLAIFLLDPNEKVRTIAYQALKLQEEAEFES